MIKPNIVKTKEKMQTIIISVGTVIVTLLVLFLIVNYVRDDIDIRDQILENNEKSTTITEDLVIPINEVTREGSFYPITLDNTNMEIIMVKAEDDSIKMAFNTCEVCYASGNGYYEQVGNTLICQNCGNQFTMDQVGQLGRGGCNPYTIFDTDVTIANENVIFTKEFLIQSKSIFANWK